MSTSANRLATAQVRSAQTKDTASSIRLNVTSPAILLMLSGASALVFQVLWIKQLSLVVGVEVRAISVAVSAFFFGLALGGIVLGRLADRRPRPVRFYAFLEAGVAIACVGTTLALARIAPLFASMETHSPVLAFLMVCAIVAIAPFLMGGTLPVLVRAVTASSDNISRSGGTLYAANTTGAIAGALLPAFFLIPHFGVQGTAWVAAGLNLLAAVGALALDRKTRPFIEVRPVLASSAVSADARWAVGLYAVAGGVALGYEVLWSQMILPFMSTRAFAFSIVLAVYLTGLAAGAAVYTRWAHRVQHPWRVFGLLIAAAGLVALLEVSLLGKWLPVVQTYAEATIYGWTGSQFAGMCARFVVAAASIVLLPTLLLGAAFPAVLRIAVGPDGVGRGVGAVVAWNTLGGIVGAVVTGFWLLPALGLVRTLAVLGVVAALVGGTAVLRAKTAQGSGARWLMGAIGAGTLACAVLIPSNQFARLLPGATGAQLVFYEESQGGTVAVVERRANGNRFHRLYIQGVSNSGDAMPSLRYMRLQALLPLIVHGTEPRSALVIGYGTGITAGALSQYPGLEKRVVAELLPAVLRAGGHFNGTYQAVEDPGLQIRLRDGRRELQASTDRYDLITLEPPPPSAAGVTNLYSSDFYRLAAQRLETGGVVAQWLPLPTQNVEDARALVASFIEVFPYASLWTSELHEMLLVGSLQPMPLDAATISARFNQVKTRDALKEVGVATPAALLATWVTDRDGLARFADGADPVTDDQPRIEYATWVRPREFGRVLPQLLAQRSTPQLANADAALLADIQVERANLDTFYAAALAAYSGNREAWARNMTKLAREASDNPYYAWFLGGGAQ